MTKTVLAAIILSSAAGSLMWAGCGHRISLSPAVVPGPPHVYREQSIDDIVAEGADGSVKQAKQAYGVTLDYTPDSVQKVDAILTKLHGEYMKDKDQKRWTMEGLGWGAYVGEVIRRQYGGHWRKTDPETGNPLPLVWRNGTSFPVTWCLGQIINGPRESVWAKFRLLTSPEYTRAYSSVKKA